MVGLVKQKNKKKKPKIIRNYNEKVTQWISPILGRSKLITGSFYFLFFHTTNKKRTLQNNKLEKKK